ncbi:MAG: class I SAM-dependent methyltransferase [Planctomycetes bacterium]|nr:class I SAM-dependent methyltransferase [Planctomycetota bacterium]
MATESAREESGSIPHDTTIVGNVYPKYTTWNPLARWLMRGFLAAVTDLYRQAAPNSVLEVGCGEGYLAQKLLECGPRPERFEACDLSIRQVVGDLDPLIRVREASVYELPYAAAEFDLVVCCEVLEHLDDPPRALGELCRVAKRHLLVSTPREPLWRMLNLLRGRYLARLGNTPGHVQHFSATGLVRLCERHFQVLVRRNPLPWTVLLGEMKQLKPIVPAAQGGW